MKQSYEHTENTRVDILKRLKILEKKKKELESLNDRLNIETLSQRKTRALMGERLNHRFKNFP